MRMSRVLYGLAALPLLAGVALAQTPSQSIDGKLSAKEPMRLTAQQMDKVTAGWGFTELDIFNTGLTVISVYQNRVEDPCDIYEIKGLIGTGNPSSYFGPGNTIDCPNCYLSINNFALSVASQFGRY